MELGAAQPRLLAVAEAPWKCWQSHTHPVTAHPCAPLAVLSWLSAYHGGGRHSDWGLLGAAHMFVCLLSRLMAWHVAQCARSLQVKPARGGGIKQAAARRTGTKNSLEPFLWILLRLGEERQKNRYIVIKLLLLPVITCLLQLCFDSQVRRSFVVFTRSCMETSCYTIFGSPPWMGMFCIFRGQRSPPWPFKRSPEPAQFIE